MSHVNKQSLITAVVISTAVISLIGSNYVLGQQQLASAMSMNSTSNKTASNTNVTSKGINATIVPLNITVTQLQDAATSKNATKALSFIDQMASQLKGGNESISLMRCASNPCCKAADACGQAGGGGLVRYGQTVQGNFIPAPSVCKNHPDLPMCGVHTQGPKPIPKRNSCNDPTGICPAPKDNL
jgi:hypothetical protein